MNIRKTTTLLAALLAAALLQSSRSSNAGVAPAAGADPAPAAPARPLFFDPRDYGASGDAKTLDTDAINKAIDAASAAGGGTVFFRAGVYPAFSIHLQSNITLYLDSGAVLLAAGPTLGGLRGTASVGEGIGRRPAPGTPAAGPNAYDAAEPNPPAANYQDFGHTHFHNSFLWGENLHDISILGPGMIDGNGLSSDDGPNNLAVGNKALALKNCRNVTLRDFTFYRGGWFAILATGVDNFTVDNVRFDTTRDGMDIDSCKNVRISNCLVNSPTDDGICLKSDFALGAPRACENITITNCQVSGYACGTLLDGTFNRSRGDAIGRIKFGTESNGGFKNITISNCVFDHCRGLAIESVDGGPIEDVTINNITMRDITNAPLFIRLGNRARGPAGKTPVATVRRINISNISASGVTPNGQCLIAGLPDHPIEDLQLSNIRIAFKGGSTQQANPNPAEMENGYPEPANFGILPASAFFIRHVKGLEMHHINLTFDRPDTRPPFALVDVAGADFQHMKTQRFDNVPYFTLTKVTDFSIQYLNTLTDTKRDQIDKDSISK